VNSGGAGSGVHLVVNGAALELDAPASIADIVARLCVSGRYAVEVNATAIGWRSCKRSAAADGAVILRPMLSCPWMS